MWCCWAILPLCVSGSLVCEQGCQLPEMRAAHRHCQASGAVGQRWVGRCQGADCREHRGSKSRCGDRKAQVPPRGCVQQKPMTGAGPGTRMWVSSRWAQCPLWERGADGEKSEAPATSPQGLLGHRPPQGRKKPTRLAQCWRVFLLRAAERDGHISYSLPQHGGRAG